MRALVLLAVAILCVIASVGEADTTKPFAEWLEALLTEARGRGFGDELLAQTLAGLTPLPSVIASDRRQAESVLTFEEYLRRRVTPERVQRARDLRAEHREVLERVREAYGVPPAIVVSIWGLESRFGEHRGEIPVFQALATLAWEGRRAPFFRAQLYDALRIVDRGYIDAASMKGSWAGAMGQPQFMPSSYLSYAVDFDGDGRRDIWGSPADTFASIANYLAKHGWEAGGRWGFEVQATDPVVKRATRTLGQPQGGCRAMREAIGPATIAAWQRLGVRQPDGEALPNTASKGALVLAGQMRFLVHDNYDAILRYNCSHSYALSVALLADRSD